MVQYEPEVLASRYGCMGLAPPLAFLSETTARRVHYEGITENSFGYERVPDIHQGERHRTAAVEKVDFG